MQQPFEIRIDDLHGAQVQALLSEHLRDMHATSPPDSVHALDLAALRQPEISFWCVWSGDLLAGCGALKQLHAAAGEVKSMRTAAAFRRRGVAALMLQHIVDEALLRGCTTLFLETGSMAYFEPARALYRRAGFETCDAFEGYAADPNSVFMRRDLGRSARV